MKKIIIAAVALVMGATVPGLADTRTYHRENRQEQRINQGAVRGDLTPREYRKLQQQQRRIDRAQFRAGRDGYISPRERRELQRMQNRASKNIYRKKNNGRVYY